MLNITVYGPGCARCKETEKRVRHVAEESAEANVTHCTDPVEMAKAGILRTPAVAVGGVIKVAGRIPEEQEIREWLSDVRMAGTGA